MNTKGKQLLHNIRKYYLPYIAILIVLLVCLIVRPGQLASVFLQEIAIAIILATSLNVVVGYLGELSLGHAGFMCIGAYIGGKIATMIDGAGGMIVSLLIGGICASVAGALVGLPALRLKGDYLAIITLAFGEIVRTLFLNSSEATFNGAFGLATPTYQPQIMLYVTFIVAMFAIAVFQNLNRSKHGRNITAIRDSEVAAKATGVNVIKYKLVAFIVSAFFAGVAGVLYSYTQPIVLSDKFTYNYSIEILVMVVFGGIGNLNGSIIAAAVITYLNNKLSVLLTGDLAILQHIIYAVVLIIIVIYTNAPSLRGFREKYNLRNLMQKLIPQKKDPAVIGSDAGSWDKIPTKIEMNEVLSTDLVVNESVHDTADKGER